MIGEMTFLNTKYAPPMISNNADVSPIVPGTNPKNDFITSTLFPCSITASGVAVVTPSYVKLVILAANEIIKKHLAPRAGFIKFCPNPPNTCFTTMIAKIPPRIGIQNGAPDGKFNASNSPVNAALKSPTVIGCFISFW